MVDATTRVARFVRSISIFGRFFLARMSHFGAMMRLHMLAVSNCTFDGNVGGGMYNMGGGSMAEVDVSPPRPFKLASGTTLYAVVKLIDAFTFGAVNDVIIRVHILRN